MACHGPTGAPPVESCGFDVVEPPQQTPVNPCLPGPGVAGVFGPETFTRDKGKPAAVQNAFTLSAAGTICLVVNNGDGTPDTRTASARLAIDGEEVIGPGQFSKTVQTIEERIYLEAGEHNLETLVTSKPGSFISVQILFSSGEIAPPFHPVTGENERIVAFNLFDGPDPLSPNGDGIDDETEFRADVLVGALPGNSSGAFDYLLRYQFEVFDGSTCTRVRQLSGEQAVTSEGTVRVVALWDGRSGDGSLMADGTYYYRLSLDYVRRHKGSQDESVLDSVATQVQAVTVVRPVREDICLDGAGEAPLRLSWLFNFDGVQLASSLSLKIESREPVEVQLHLVSQGLDSRTVERPYGSFILPAEGSRTIQVALAELPLQSVSYSALGTVRATFTRVDGSVMAQHAPDFYHHFSDDYEETFVYHFDTMVRELNGGQLTDNVYDLRGRVWQDDSFIDIGEVRWEFYGGPPPDESGPLVDWGEWTGEAFQPVEGFPVCVDWETRYIDAFPGEDYVKSLGTQAVDASYAAFQIGRITSSTPCVVVTPESSCVEIVSGGWLDKNGCTKLPDAIEGESYIFWIYTKMKKSGGINVDVKYHDDSGNEKGTQRWRLSFSVPPPMSPLPPAAYLTTDFHPATNAAAVMSRLLTLPDLLVPASSYKVNVNKDCPDSKDNACAVTTVVFTGKWNHSTPGVPGDLQYKYVLAHEAGHVVQLLGSGRARYNHDGNPYDNEASKEPLCKCEDIVVTSNKKHCLQSRETTAVAQNEGFAHFVAAKLFNDAAGDDCGFNYYKEFKASATKKVTGPPNNIDCRNPVTWRNEHCPDNNVYAGTEYDWLQFLWNLNAVGDNTSTVNDIYEIWKYACGYHPVKCQDEFQLLWNSPSSAVDLQAAANTHFKGDPRYEKFLGDGAKFGVDDAPAP